MGVARSYPRKYTQYIWIASPFFSNIFEKSAHTLRNGGQTEVGGADVCGGEPGVAGGIVGGGEAGAFGDLHLEEEIGRVHVEAAKRIDIGLRKEEAHDAAFDAELFAQFAQASLLDTFAWGDESARKIEGAAGGVVGAAHSEQLASGIAHHGYGCGRGIGIEGEAAIGAALGIGIVNGPMGAATMGAKSESGEGMWV